MASRRRLCGPPLSTFRVDTRAAGRRLAERCPPVSGEGPEALRALARARFLDRLHARPTRRR